MADLLSSHTSHDHLGFFLVEGSASTSWISNNSPNSLDLSGITHGLSYLKLTRITQQDEKYTHLFTSWHVGDGQKAEYTYGDDDGLHTFFAKLTGSTLYAVHTAKKACKRFSKVHNRGSADRVYFFNRFASSADGFEYFYGNALSAYKYAPVLVRDVSYGWTESTNKIVVARFIVEEVWPAE